MRAPKQLQHFSTQSKIVYVQINLPSVYLDITEDVCI